jgi:hypothetical protein
MPSVSARKLDANRKNALRSSGPNSLKGKLRSRDNARKHGLAAKIGSTELERRRVEYLASKIAAGSNDIWVVDRARYVAECQVHLERVKAASAQALKRLSAAQRQERKQFDDALDALTRLEIYERKALSRRKRAIRDFRSSDVGPTQ